MRVRSRLRSTLVAASVAVAMGVTAAPSQAVVNGSPASPGEYPYMAAVYLGNPSGGQFCGGTLVRPTIVITAAHCILGVPAPVIGGVLIGRTTLNGTGGEMIPAAGWVIHPAWNVGLNIFDIAAIKLTRASTATPLPWATKADATYFAPGDTATVLGWGAVCEGCGGSNQLLEATVPIVSDASCTASYGISHVPSQHLCAGYPNGGTDTCQGDSGGPLMVKNGSNQFILAGITSWGAGCARPNRPGVYSEVAELATFIQAAALL